MRPAALNAKRGSRGPAPEAEARMSQRWTLSQPSKALASFQLSRWRPTHLAPIPRSVSTARECTGATTRLSHRCTMPPPPLSRAPAVAMSPSPDATADVCKGESSTEDSISGISSRSPPPRRPTRWAVPRSHTSLWEPQVYTRAESLFTASPATGMPASSVTMGVDEEVSQACIMPSSEPERARSKGVMAVQVTAPLCARRDRTHCRSSMLQSRRFPEESPETISFSL
mmetsp:Transcript_19087/g.53551  ORF Transcript_19087/g.53551 Transcript_19087/m.53551 type:complete len:228 (+) Transcript_19087:340-1023(+)